MKNMVAGGEKVRHWDEWGFLVRKVSKTQRYFSTCELVPSSLLQPHFSTLYSLLGLLQAMM